MDLRTITQELANLKAQAAKINAEINSAPSKEIKKLRTAEYMTLSARIAELKSEKSSALANLNPSKNSVVTTKIATLLFPKEQRVQYFATNDTFVELLITLQDVFGEDIPAVTTYFSVSADQVDSIPKEWYELVEDEKDTITE
jgi:hypothetical protein